MKHKTLLLLIICSSFFFVINAQYQHPQGRFIEVNGIKLWIEMEGKGEPLFLIAGGPGYSHLYLHSFDALKDSSLLVFVDYYGRGKSDTATEAKNYSIEKDVEDVEGVRKALGFDKINLLGHSFGSVVIQLYAIKYGEHVNHLIIADGLYNGKMYQEIDDNANHIISESQPELWDSIMLVRKKGYISSNPLHYNLYFKFLLGLLFFYNPENATKLPQDPAYPNDFNFKYYYQLTGSDGDFVIGPNLAKYDVTTQLKDLKMPVLIINGRYDKACTPKSSIKYKEYCPQAQFVMFENSGHFPQVEEPEKEFTVIKEFLRK
jgi:proline iminopeptidase